MEINKMAKKYKITKNYFSRREDKNGNYSKKGKFVYYSASDNNVISMEKEQYLHLKERLGLQEHKVVASTRKSKGDDQSNTNQTDENQTNEGSE